MAIGKDVKLGKCVRIYHPDLVNLYQCVVGDETRIGAFVEIQGRRCNRLPVQDFISQFYLRRSHD